MWRVCDRCVCVSVFLCQQCEVAELRKRLQKEEEDKLALESRIREEVTNEFMELFSKIEEDYK